MPTESEAMSRRQSWPPTQVRLNPPASVKHGTGEPRPLLEDIDENPLTYFLTPAEDGEDGRGDGMDLDDGNDDEDDEDMMDFDAGIEDPSQPRQVIRSVSPSSLEGLRKPRRRASPEFDSEIPTTDEDDDDDDGDDDDDDDDDDGEDYIRFSSSPNRTMLSPLQRLAISDLRPRNRSPPVCLVPPKHLPAPSGSSISNRGRTNVRGGGGGGGTGPRRQQQQTGSLSVVRARPNRLWRGPSPDVWSIEEETEEELVMSGRGGDAAAAAKPKKRVRFVLPVEE